MANEYMAKSTRKKSSSPSPLRSSAARRAVLRKWLPRLGFGLVGFVLFMVALFSVINPPTTFYMQQESRRLGGVSQNWSDWDQIAPVMARSAVAAEDANFCLHWGFDMGAIRAAFDAGSNRGASTITQQVVKNVYLWHGRSWARKAMEAVLTPMVELLWSKTRILEVYLNVAEFGEGTFGIHAAAKRYFGTTPDKLTASQAARLAAALPDPQNRNPAKPTDFMRRRANAIQDGAATIRADGRAACFMD